MSGYTVPVWISFGLFGLCTGSVLSQDYPSKPVRIVTTNPGGGTDFAARMVAQGLSTVFKQQVIVDNRGSGVIPGQIVASAAPDGYTLLVTGDPFWVEPLFQKVPYDMIRDFAPISYLSSSANTLVVHPSLPVKTVKDLITLAKARRGELNYSSTGIGSSTFLTAELFNMMAGVNIVHIPYRGGAGSMVALISGQVQVSFGSGTSILPHLTSGKLRAIAVTSAQPSILFPKLPTVGATLPGYEISAARAIFAPAKTPKALVDRLHDEVVRVLNQKEFKDQFLKLGEEVVASTPEQLSGKMKSDITKYNKLIVHIGVGKG